mmetsp:Transcript_113913/g.223464  ORF Transcript_113913/g.223464 Transcript_113913/m.223464 type:complete len:310 (+) Transcript_113913:58-987(+)|eukprot:CAMPEP_0170265382 /NCGR_PEP_ID=MMETSP0116_2-20130129/32596_1 /TAXON_ID=400756 /ORGANISM="Durinskia baltica, Strain CSIRO CS-38" /LENGTH=309 /DNA_ID=CAMNT_0010516495 /DNA_START=58 /DNA_END=987 /DNA_ORIENTATION=-
MVIETAWRAITTLLISVGGGLTVASLARTPWWTSRNQSPNVVRETTYSLWTKVVSADVGHIIGAGKACTSSDECAEGTWCRKGTHRCWSDSDCSWHHVMHDSELERDDCERFPRAVPRSTVDDLCASGDADELPCDSLVIVRSIVFVSAGLILAACPCAMRLTPLASLVSVVGAIAGITAAIFAATLHIPDAHAHGSGFRFLILGSVLALMGSASIVCHAWRTARQKQLNDIASAPLATRYGMEARTTGEAEGPGPATADAHRTPEPTPSPPTKDLEAGAIDASNVKRVVGDSGASHAPPAGRVQHEQL